MMSVISGSQAQRIEDEIILPRGRTTIGNSPILYGGLFAIEPNVISRVKRYAELDQNQLVVYHFFGHRSGVWA